MNNWIKKYENPEALYRPHPFWSWNDRLEEEELRHQIRLLAQSGHGGFFMHARDGLETPYLGEEWFRLINACADEAKKQGMLAWCYDENGWPSGSAGGAVPEAKYENQQFVLRCIPYNKDEATRGDVLGWYAVNEDLTYMRLDADSGEAAAAQLKGGQTLYYCTAIPDGSYIDLLNPAVVKDFIDSTHEKYDAAANGALQNGDLAGFFTDEPQYTLCKTPWTTIAKAEFDKRYGYDIIEHIPALFLQSPNKEAVRFDYWKMISDLYCNSFMKQIYDWCSEHGTKLTGHVMMEDNLLCQMHCTGGAMPAYEHMHIPGIDWLGRGMPDSNGREGVPVLPLQLGSVAAQLGKKQTLTETYAMCGWNASFAELRHLADWQYLNGVNLMCQHLVGYSLRGRRKNDYPPSMFYQSPFWKDYNVFCDTLARMGKLFAEAEDDTHTLMLHPMHSIWIKYTNYDMNGEGDFDKEFCETSLKLSEYHIPYHFGDETLMAKYGSVNGKTLVVGNCKYDTVMIPRLYGMDQSTYELLNEYADNGGNLVYIGSVEKLPEYIDGRYAKDELSKLFSKMKKADIEKEEEFLQYVADSGLNEVEITDKTGVCRHIQYRCRTNEGKKLYFFVNMDRNNAHRVKITLNEANANELLLDTMKLVSHPARIIDGKLELDVIFEPMESHLFVADDSREAAPLALRYRESMNTNLGNVWHLSSKSTPNTLLLEYCRVLNDDGTWSAPHHNYRCVHPATSGVRKRAPALKYTVDIDDDTDLAKLCDVKMVSEFKLPVTFTVNGTAVQHTEGEWWLDHQFKVYNIAKMLKHGENEIVVTDFCNEKEVEGGKMYHNRAEFGNMYLLGNFGVYSNKPYVEGKLRSLTTHGSFTLRNRPEILHGTDLVRQGHAFFAGTVILEQDINIDNINIPRHIRFNSVYGTYAYLVVNGNRSDLLSWNDIAMDITPYLVEGINHIEVELTVGNRNLLGPHHFVTPEDMGVGPTDFYPYELSKWKYRYSFGRIGIE